MLRYGFTVSENEEEASLDARTSSSLGTTEGETNEERPHRCVVGKCHANVIYLWTLKGLMDVVVYGVPAVDTVESIDGAEWCDDDIVATFSGIYEIIRNRPV